MLVPMTDFQGKSSHRVKYLKNGAILDLAKILRVLVCVSCAV